MLVQLTARQKCKIFDEAIEIRLQMRELEGYGFIEPSSNFRQLGASFAGIYNHLYGNERETKSKQFLEGQARVLSELRTYLHGTEAFQLYQDKCPGGNRTSYEAILATTGELTKTISFLAMEAQAAIGSVITLEVNRSLMGHAKDLDDARNQLKGDPVIVEHLNKKVAEAGKASDSEKQITGRIGEKKRGRKLETNPDEDKKTYEAWKAGSYRTYEEFGKVKGLSKNDVRKAIDRHETRLGRKQKPLE